MSVADLPDVSSKVANGLGFPIERVGMGDIEMPFTLQSEKGKMLIPSRVDLFVNLSDSQTKGIHMSRLYKELQDSFQSEPLSYQSVLSILIRSVEGQKGLSDNAFISVKFDWPVKRKALKSGGEGWRQYPIEIRARLKEGVVEYECIAQVMYSSTCPCSAALARQLVREEFNSLFSGSVLADDVAHWLSTSEAMVATPHAQRSIADIQLKKNLSAKDAVGGDLFSDLRSIIDEAEEALGTPVQSFVKREDEQEFARLNGGNLMFCEDAVRRLKATFEGKKDFSDYYICVKHIESLHPHNAVSATVKGVAGGYTL